MSSYMKDFKNVENPILSKGTFITYGFTTDPKSELFRLYGGNHLGTDVRTPVRGAVDNVIAIADGVVESIKTDVTQTQMAITSANLKSPSAAGNWIKIKHNSKYSSRYCHLTHGTIKLKVGDKVKKGQVLGVMGLSGVTNGVHVHFEIYENGTRVNPEPFILGTKSFRDTNTAATQSTTTSTTITKTTTDALNLRDAPSTNGKIIVVIPKSAKVTIRENGAWARVDYRHSNNKIYTGFCSANYLQ